MKDKTLNLTSDIELFGAITIDGETVDLSDGPVSEETVSQIINSNKVGWEIDAYSKGVSDQELYEEDGYDFYFSLKGKYIPVTTPESLKEKLTQLFPQLVNTTTQTP
jgi:hypothetical protein